MEALCASHNLANVGALGGVISYRIRLPANSSVPNTSGKSASSVALCISRPEELTPRSESAVKHASASPRRVLLASIAAVGAFSVYPGSKREALASDKAKDDRLVALLGEATEAWERGLDPRNMERFKDLYQACATFDQIVALDPQRAEWLEARGQVEVDAKRFDEALADFNEVLRRDPRNYRAYSSRALAHEGLADWQAAVSDYSTALRMGRDATGADEPYVMNSRGNALASLGRYREALQDYDRSVRAFQRAKELDAAIYASSNAALLRIQLGEEEEGRRELAAGKQQLAEGEWNFACENINPGQVFDGCAKYRDQDWLLRIRRWPPVMAQRMDDFLRLRSATAAAQ
eukprot:jgi/Mesen1/8047/ME000043S07428